MIAGPVAVIPLPVAVACGRHPSGMWPWPVAVDKMGGPVAVVRNVGGAGILSFLNGALTPFCQLRGWPTAPLLRARPTGA